jgi:acylphosphatase
MSSARLLISGVVQGVCFRYYTVSSANDLKIRGWVRNLPDGRVEAEVVGEKGLIIDLIQQLKIGPPGSRVTGIDVRWLPEDPSHKSFIVKYF